MDQVLAALVGWAMSCLESQAGKSWSSDRCKCDAGLRELNNRLDLFEQSRDSNAQHIEATPNPGTGTETLAG